MENKTKEKNTNLNIEQILEKNKYPNTTKTSPTIYYQMKIIALTFI